MSLQCNFTKMGYVSITQQRVVIAGLTGGEIHIQGYTDDICLLAVGMFPNTLSGLMQWALHTADTWCNESWLLVNPNKTEFVLFTKRKKLPGFFQLHSLGVSLIRSMSVKYLGVVLDSRLT
jgi:hypothetical protein